MNEMNIVLTTDDNYAVPTMVTISSILSSAEAGTWFHIYILCAEDLGPDVRQRIAGIQEKYRQADVTFVEVRDEKLDFAVTTAYIPVASYYRLYMGSLIPADRCLFIDGDMIVRRDLAEVYGVDLDGYYAAGVRDMGVQCHFADYESYAAYLGIPNMHTYVNAGFLVFNLKKMREDGMDRKMTDYIGRGYKYMDQDIINKLCHGKIRLLPLRYDFFTEYYNSLPEWDLSGYSLQELEGIGQEPAVYHFTGIFKPWVCTRLTVNRIWWDEAEKILDAGLYENVLASARESERKSDWEYIAGAVTDKKQAVVFGCSGIGLKVARGLSGQTGLTVVLADNDAAKTGKTAGGFPVLSAAEACQKYPDALYVISSQNGFSQIGAQLADLGISEKNILRYIHKDETYYSRLNARYAEHEKKQMRMCGQQ